MINDNFPAGRDIPLSAILLRGMLCRCPRCGQSRLFRGLLTLIDNCRHCGLSYADHDMGDGPAVAGTFIIGFIALATMVILEFAYTPPMWVHLVISVPLILGGSLAVLRPLKGVTLAIQFRYRDVDKPTPPGGG